MFIDIIGLPWTPLSYAGVARRAARRAYWYGAATAPRYPPYGYPPPYPPPYRPYYPYGPYPTGTDASKSRFWRLWLGRPIVAG